PSCCTPLFECPLVPRPLHSLPTRRSSDLNRAHPRLLHQSTVCPKTRTKPPDSVRPSLVVTGCNPHRGWSERAAFSPCTSQRCRRSEEHTSELQSRENLVCRLLLEKKKKSR